MAADDDKISTNRRRLFKALSAAPVVATLRPGEVLAGASALQCLDNGSETIDAFLKDATRGDTYGRYLYEYHSWWKYGSNGIGDCPDVFKNSASRKIVEIAGDYYTFENEKVTGLVNKRSDSKLDLLKLKSDGSVDRCKTTSLEKQNGLFLVVVEPQDQSGKSVFGSSGDAVRFHEVGVYPRVDPNSGVNQAVNSACVRSFTDVIPSSRVLSKG